MSEVLGRVIDDSAWQPPADLACGTFHHPLKLQLELQTSYHTIITINVMGMYIAEDLHWEVKFSKTQC